MSMEKIMDREHIKGAADKAKAVKEAAGKMTGHETPRAESKSDKAKGPAHKAAGDMRATGDMKTAAPHGPKSTHE